MVCNRLYSNGITQVDQFGPAEFPMLIEIDNNIVEFDVYTPALVRLRKAEDPGGAFVLTVYLYVPCPSHASSPDP